MSNFCVNKHQFDFVEENAHHQINKSNRLTDVCNFYYLAKHWDWNLHRGISTSTLRNIGSGIYFCSDCCSCHLGLSAQGPELRYVLCRLKYEVSYSCHSVSPHLTEPEGFGT